MECKGKWRPSKRPTNRVLIETYWNVKTFCDVFPRAVRYVLIETYWNVKIPRYFDPFFERGINRNILECKGKWSCAWEMPGIVLIETYWNVKEYPQEIKAVVNPVLIETYWNVKYSG